MTALTSFLDTYGLLPHGICLTWRPELLWLHAVSDAVTALAYYSIPLALLVFAWRRRDLQFRWVFVLFGVFITACGTTHVMGLLTLWVPLYAEEGLVKAVTALSSILTTAVLFPLIPKALALPGPAQWEAVNSQLRNEVAERREAEAEVRRLNAELERRVAERTAELAATNAELRGEVETRKRAEQELRDSEAMTRAILETAVDAIITIDGHGVILVANTAAEQLFGYAVDEIVGQNISLLMPERYASAHDGHLARFRETGERRIIGVGREVEGRRKDGSTFPMELSVGEAIARGARLLTGIVRDITERKRAEQELARLNASLELRVQERTAQLEAANQRLAGITNNLFEGVLLVDDEGMVAFANPSAHRLLSNGGQTVEGQPVDGIFRVRQQGHEVSFVQSSLAATAREGQMVCDHDAQIVTSCGKIVDVACACSPLKERTGLQGTIISIRDIQVQKAAQREAGRASRLASVGQLAAGIAHEINTPTQYVGDNIRFCDNELQKLIPLLGAVEELLRSSASDEDLMVGARRMVEVADGTDLGFLREEIPQAMQDALDGVRQIARIVLSMKEFAHPGSNDKGEADINHAIENTLVVSRNSWRHMAIVETDFAADLPSVLCYLPEINQVLLNLITNAVDAIEASGKPQPGRIRISTRLADGGVMVGVEDSGSGVPDSIRERIFDPFFTTKAVGKGTGQGLAISHDIVVAKHHGRLEVSGGEGGGAIFTMWLPCGHQPAQAIPQAATTNDSLGR